jgi:plastocyanin
METAVSATTNTNFTLGAVSVSFTSGSPATKYQWYRNTTKSTTGATLLTGKTANSLTTQESTAGTYYYYCEMTNAECSATSVQTAFYTVTVTIPCPSPVAGSVSPSTETAVSATTNTNFTLGAVSVSFTSGSPATKYQWYRNTTKSTTGATLLTGKTANSLTTQESTAGTYYYYCEMTNADCTTTSVQTGFYIVTAKNLSDLAAGTGNFTGKICFDIAFSNFGGGCGTLASRTANKTDFSLTSEQDFVAGTSNAVYTGRQVYTFTPSGDVSNVRFAYIDASGQAIESMTPKYDYSGNFYSGQTPKVLVVYKASLNTILQGKTRDTALKPELYVIYNDQLNKAGIDRFLKVTVSLQDCNCCGAATVSGGWLTFMCHNLGADESLDPFTYVVGNADGSGGTLGWLFQWGRRADGHQKRNSGTTTTLSSSDTPGHTSFILNLNSPYDWRVGGSNPSRWGDGTNNLNQTKATNDPCPEGWKVPSIKQWASIFTGSTAVDLLTNATANTWKWNKSGVLVGSELFLPATQGRLPWNGEVGTGDRMGRYWVSDPMSAGWARCAAWNWMGTLESQIRFAAGEGAGDMSAGEGSTVRCVSE